MQPVKLLLTGFLKTFTAQIKYLWVEMKTKVSAACTRQRRLKTSALTRQHSSHTKEKAFLLKTLVPWEKSAATIKIHKAVMSWKLLVH
jgi:hypothetical protein